MQLDANATDLKVAVLASGPSTGEFGGAERFYQGLVDGFRKLGCRVELIHVPADERSFEEIIENYRRCSALDLSKFDMVVSTKAPTFAINHPRHIMYLVHTVRVFDDMFSDTFPDAGRERFRERAALHQLDFKAMSRAKARFSIGYEVANRLYRWRGLTSEVIHPPFGIDGFVQGESGDYFFMPGRLHQWKRVELVVDAVRRSSMPLRLIVSGTGEAEQNLKRRAGGDPRIEFIGRVSDSELINLYSRALAVPFVSVREDYGYVTLEAFASGKPVVTCLDSGEPTHFVTHHWNGLICKPEPRDIQEALEWLFTHREDAAQLGLNARASLPGLSWRDVAARLIDAAMSPETQTPESRLKVSVLDMQPIDPPIGGGRMRLLGLYHGLGADIDCLYVGSYDWPGERARTLRLSECLEEVDVPLSDEHHAAASALSAKAAGKTVIDTSFSELGNLSTDYVSTAHTAVQGVDVVVFSHPWVYPLVKNQLRPGQVVIYDAQNVEGYLRAQLFDERNPPEADLLRQVIRDEYELGGRADLILACSQEDLDRFVRVYDFRPEKIRVIPNGVMTFPADFSQKGTREGARHLLALPTDRRVAIFLGSAYGPNLEAGRFIVEQLAPAVSNVTFVIAGGVGEQLESKHKNVVITGTLSESEKDLWLRAADFAVNPMFSGSGTNIKMFDFMAACLPTITTETGARGIDTAGRECMLVVEPTTAGFLQAIEGLNDEAECARIGSEARACVEEGYSWERISVLVGSVFKTQRKLKGQPAPLFSVIVPTYERHDQLDRLVARLSEQTERDFEVVIVDQSAIRWPGCDVTYPFPLTYFLSPVKGAVRARNTGATLAQGRILAFTDDDCLPEKDWLLNGRAYFDDPSVVGIEGHIFSDHENDPNWRMVTNVGFEGIGFMTANLFVRCDVFAGLGGFDLQFDRPHFREDTDFGWRMLENGLVPYGNDVRVFHPAQPRAIERESATTRGKFFQKDALLYRKHPGRYQELFLRERQYEATPGFTENLLKGFADRKMEIPAWMKPYLGASV